MESTQVPMYLPFSGLSPSVMMALMEPMGVSVLMSQMIQRPPSEYTLSVPVAFMGG